jgi:hypothetical protein
MAISKLYFLNGALGWLLASGMEAADLNATGEAAWKRLGREKSSHYRNELTCYCHPACLADGD